MKKKTGAVLGVLFLAVAMYFGITRQLTHEVRCACEQECPELVWLKAEYSLTDQQFQRISVLHNSHELHCGHICRDLKRCREKLVSMGNSQTSNNQPMREALKEWRKVRDHSQDLIIDHMFQVSSEMNELEGRKYREHVFYTIITPDRKPHIQNSGRLNVQLTTQLRTTASN